MKRKEPTATLLVYEVLLRSGDFRTSHQLVEETRETAHRVNVALYGLLHYKAVAVMPVPIPGYIRPALYWYATPDSDTRCRVVEERVPEVRGRTLKIKIVKE